MDYDGLKRAVIYSSTYLSTDHERRTESMALHANQGKFSNSRKESKTGTGLERNQCAYCLKKNPRWRECRSYLTRKPPGMAAARNFPLPPKATPQNGGYDQGGGSKAFLTMNAMATDWEVPSGLGDDAMVTSPQDADKDLRSLRLWGQHSHDPRGYKISRHLALSIVRAHSRTRDSCERRPLKTLH